MAASRLRSFVSIVTVDPLSSAPAWARPRGMPERNILLPFNCCEIGRDAQYTLIETKFPRVKNRRDQAIIAVGVRQTRNS
jgi:hypothetical protein